MSVRAKARSLLLKLANSLTLTHSLSLSLSQAKYKNQPVAVKRIDISLNKDGKPDRKTKTAIKMFKREVDGTHARTHHQLLATIC